MNKKFLKQDRQDCELYKRVDEVLHYIWDPLGVNDEPYARDEYSSYVHPVFVRVKTEDNVDTIIKYLNEIRNAPMGLSRTKESRENDEIVANLLLEHKKYVQEFIK